MGPGGALEAAVEARAQGLVRFVGVTGHGWTIAAMHKRSLARFDFDAVLLPYNFFMAQNERYRTTFGEVLSICGERNVAVQHELVVESAFGLHLHFLGDGVER